MYELIQDITANGYTLKFGKGNYDMILCTISKRMDDNVIVSCDIGINPEMLEDSIIPNEIMAKCLTETYNKVKAEVEKHIPVTI